MARCPKCGCTTAGTSSYRLCSNCQMKEDNARREKERIKDDDYKRRREIEKVRETDPARANEMLRDLKADINRRDSSGGGGGSYFVPIVVGLLILVAIVSAVVFFGKGVYMNFAGETGAMSVIRDEKSATFLKKGENIPQEEIAAKKAALEEFTKSGASYQMEGEFRYGRYESGHTAELITDVEMSYNAETDVYAFLLASRLGDEKLNKTFRISDGTYYIIKEEGKTYVLSEIDGKKAAVDVKKSNTIFNFLMSYRMETVLYIGVIDRTGSDRLLLWDADYYRCLYDDIGYMVFSNPKTELRIYNNKPVYYLHKLKNKETGVEYLFTLNFYYDHIELEKPDLAEYMNN